MESSQIPDSEYKKILDLSPICTVDIVIFNVQKNKILLCKRQNEPLLGIYFTNGGRLLKGEELEDCAVRQAIREAGVIIDKNKLVFGGVVSEIWDKSKYENVSYHSITVFFGCLINESTQIKLDSQHSTYKWFDIRDLGLHKNIKFRIDNLINKI